MGRTGVDRAQAPPPSGWSTAGTVAAYAAAIVAFAYALVSLYWAVGGHGLLSTVGGYVEQFATYIRAVGNSGREVVADIASIASRS